MARIWLHQYKYSACVEDVGCPVHFLQVYKLRYVKNENIEIMCFTFQIEFNV